MKKVMVRSLSALSVMGVLSAFGAGFALYEGSSSAVALGGGVMGKAVDGSAVFYNPATMTDFTNTVVTVGFVTEHPTADVSINSSSANKMDPGFFVLPHAYVIQPLGYDFTFGMGFAPEYGLGTHYNSGWAMNWDTTSTTIKGLVLNPNLAYKVMENWSVAAGARIMNFSFEQHSRPILGYHPAMGVMQGNNKIYDAYDWCAGWELSSKYDITEKLHAGILYKSYIDADLKGKQTVNGVVAGQPVNIHGTGGAKVRTPQSVTVGLNYDVTPDIDVGTALTWTQWSSLQAINFRLPSGPKTVALKWKDAYRLGVGASWKFADGWKLMGSYVYDMDPCRHNHKYGSTMLPAGDRHIVSTGLSYRFWQNWEIAGTAGYVIMCEDSLYKTDELGRRYKFDTHKGRSMAFGLTLSYYF